MSVPDPVGTSSPQIPPGVLESGMSYVLQFTAVASTEDRTATAPWRSGMTWSEAAVPSEPFSP